MGRSHLLALSLLAALSAGPAHAGDPFEAAQSGVDWLTAAVCDWMQDAGSRVPDCVTGAPAGCIGCHVQGQSVNALARSHARCYRLPPTACVEPGDETPVSFAARFITRCQRKDCILGPHSPTCAGVPLDRTTRDGNPPDLGSIGLSPDCGSNGPPGFASPVVQSAHGGMGLSAYTRWIGPTFADNLVALADWLVTQQQPDGRYVPDHVEPPVDQGESFVTGAAVLALSEARDHAGPAEAAAYGAAIARATAWAASAAHVTNQDFAFAILALAEADAAADDPSLLALQQALLDAQQPDGGWAERPGLLSNAYATGQAVHALHESGVSLDAPAVCRGIAWLTEAQGLDGSWGIGVTGLSTDSVRNSSFTATTWPVLALGSLRRFGVDFEPAPPVLTCADAHVATVTIRNVADDPCGMHPRLDTFELSAANDLGDGVILDPPVVTVPTRGSAAVRVHWTRRGGPRPPGTTSVTVIEAVSRGALAWGCPVTASVRLEITGAPDDVPGPVDFSLRAIRRGDDVHVTWAPLPDPVGSYEIVGLACPARGSCPEPPSAGALVRWSEWAPTASEALVAGLGRSGGDGLAFYKVRGTSPCSLSPGPTCNYDCASGHGCHAGCP